MNKKQRAEIASRLRHFSELGRAGVSMSTALAAAAADNPLTDIKGGAQTRPASFDEFLPASMPNTIALLKAGSTEESAEIAGAASELLDSQDNQSAGWSTLKVSIVGAGLTVILISIFVLPAFKEMFDSFGAELPAPTLLTFFLAQWVIAPVGAAILAVVLVSKVWKARPAMFAKQRANIDTLLTKLPVIGHAARVNDTKKFAYWFAATGLGGNTKLSLACLVELVGECRLSRQAEVLSKSIHSGRRLIDAVSESTWLSGLAMVLWEADSADSGKGDAPRRKLLAYANGLDARADALSSKLMLIAHILVGLIVGIFVLGMYLPIFKMGSSV